MKRIATPNRAIDKFAVGKDGFRAAVAGVSSATEFSDLWFNHVQEAVCRTIEAAGMVLSDTDFDQFVNALNTIISNAGEQFSTVRSLAVSTVLTVADLGDLIKITAAGTTQTFPPIASCRVGSVLSFVAKYAAGITTLKANAAELLANPFGATANTFSLNAGESIQFVSNGASWDPIGYEATVGATPAQFDNSTKLATTAGVRAAGLQARGISTISASVAIPLTAIGGTVQLSSASAIAPTLPAANTVPNGARIEFINSNTGVGTVTRAGADVISVNQSVVTSLALGAGDTLTLESDGVSAWYAVAGSVQLGSSATFGASKSASGYQKLPGGLILQWGAVTVPQSTTQTASLPIAFPNTAFVAVCQSTTGAMTATATPSFAATFPNLATISIQNNYSSSAILVGYIAIGN